MLLLLPSLAHTHQRIPAPPLSARLDPPRPPVPAVPKFELPSPPILGVEPVKQPAEPAFAVPAQALAPAAGGPDAGAIARFRIELLKIVALDKKYPPIAQDNHWEGRVELRVAIGEDGAISSITVKKSAGHAVLDEEAREMIRTAKSRLIVPPALRGADFNLDIAVEFFLKQE